MNSDPTVSAHYARAARAKQMWCLTPTADADRSARYFSAAGEAEDAMIATRSCDLAGVLMKLAMLLEWIDEDASASAKALCASIVTDLEGLVAPTSAVRANAPLRVASTPVTLKADGRGRPVVVDGVVYPSITMAARSTGRRYTDLQRTAERFR